MADNKGVMVYGELTGTKLAAITTELLGCGRRLADTLGQELSAVLLGSGVTGVAQEAIAFGADKVYVVDDAVLKDYQSDAYVTVMEKVVKQVAPSILLFGQNNVGRDLAPRLAFRLGTTASMDCLALDIDPNTKSLLQTKPTYGGNAQAVYTSATFPQIASVRTKAMTALEPNPSRKGDVVAVKADLDPAVIKAKFQEKVKAEVKGVRLEDAEVIVSGGRGIGGPDGFKKELAALADLFHGAVGASRPPVDSGWMPDTQQVGLTGKIVTPNVYIAVAISGSSQHMAGAGGSKNIVAINKDPDANIFKEARFGVVGDWKKVVPALTAKVKELLAK